MEHQYIETNGIRLHVVQDGPKEGPLVILLHGFPEFWYSWRQQIPFLASAGYQVWAPDQRGYNLSDKPDGIAAYSIHELAADVIGLIDASGQEKIFLVGHDWGAVMSYVACARAPERFHSLTTIAIPHPARFTRIGLRKVPTQLLKSWYMMFFQLRALPEYALEQSDWALIRRLWKAWSPGYGLPADEWAALRKTFETPGVKEAMLSYYRSNVSPAILLGLKSSVTTGLTEVPVRTLAITGADDGCMDTRLWEHTMWKDDFPAGLRVDRIAGGGHFVHQELPAEVNWRILEWISAT